MPDKLKIFIASDYRGDKLKAALIPYLDACHSFIDVSDLGNNSGAPDDYNDASLAVAKKVLENSGSFGILICGSGHGITIAANRFKGIRACNCCSEESAKLAREHDDANILCLAADLLDEVLAEDIVKTFFHTKFIDNSRRGARKKRLDEDTL